MIKAGDKIRRKPDERSDWWKALCKQLGVKNDHVFTVKEVKGGFLTLSEFPEDRLNYVCSRFSVVRSDWVIRCEHRGVVDFSQHTTREHARTELKILKMSYEANLKKISFYRLSTSSDGSIVLTPTKL